MATIKIPAIKLTVSTTTHVITYSDGIVITLTGSNTIATRKAAYEKAYLAANPVTPPVIVIPPATGVRDISYSDYCSLGDSQGQNFKVKPGIYTGAADHSNLKDCTFDLSGVQIVGGNQALRIHGHSINVAYHGLTLKNVEGYQIECVRNSKVQYVGSAGSFIDGLTFDGLNVDGGGQVFHADGDLLSGKVWGLLKNFRIANATIKNISYGDIIYVGCGMDAKFENITFDNINATQNNHNGVIRVHGNLIAKNILATNYQGNLIRNWLYSVEGTKTTSISNCVGYRSRKYSLIELQTSDFLFDNGAVPANAEVFNNTAISMSTSKEWDGQLVDLYNTGNARFKNKASIYNNLGADLIASQDRQIIPSEMTNKMLNSEYTDLNFSGNVYRNTWQEAVTELTSFKSLIKGIRAQ